MKADHQLNRAANEQRWGMLLLNAHIAHVRARQEAARLRERLLEHPRNELVRRQWLEALAKREFAAEEWERICTCVEISDELSAEIGAVT